MSTQSAFDEHNPAMAGEVERIVEERLLVMAEMVVYGASRRRVIDMCVQKWGVGRRTAQVYLKRVQDRMAAEAAVEIGSFNCGCRNCSATSWSAWRCVTPTRTASSSIHGSCKR